jgi:hypothetical protein
MIPVTATEIAEAVRRCPKAVCKESTGCAPNAVLSIADHHLLNGRQLTERLGVKYDFFKDMRLAGFQPPIAGMTTIGYALDWLNKNPDFRDDARILKLSGRPKLAVSPRLRGVGKSDAPQLTRGGQRS